jgi:aromatic-L-amino-acid decarboxylase
VNALGDVDLESFRREGRRAIEWIARHIEEVEGRPVLAQVAPGDVRRALPAAPPEEGEPLERLLDDFERVIVPGLTLWNHPSFFAYFANSATVPGILGELLAAAVNSNAMLWKTGPANTELEMVVLDWLRQLLGLPAGLFGVIQDTASAASLVALCAAREAVPGLDARRRGLVGQARLRHYASEQAHSSIEKAGIVLGTGQDGLRKIAVDHAFRLDPRALAAAIAEDRAAGFTPFAVTATAGTTSTTSVDPLPEVAELCRREGLWLHVDAAYGGSAAVVPELRPLFDGWELADSIVVNPHKWLFTPMDLSVLYTRRPDVLKQAFSLVPEYLRTPEDDVAPNLMDYGVSLGRRFRALKLWMVLRAFGRAGLVARLREHVRLAQVFRGWVEAHPGFEVVAPSPLSVVCFQQRRPGEDLAAANRAQLALMERVNRGGEAYLSHTALRGRTTLRLAVGNVRTEERHVRRAWELVRAAAQPGNASA